MRAVLEGVRLVIAHQLRRGAGQHRRRFQQRHGLQERVVVAGGREPGLAELRGDVSCGDVVASGRSSASFEQIAGQEFDVTADRLGAHSVRGRQLGGAGRECGCSEQQGCQNAHGTP
jgi:hypothetical protein